MGTRDDNDELSATTALQESEQALVRAKEARRVSDSLSALLRRHRERNHFGEMIRDVVQKGSV